MKNCVLPALLISTITTPAHADWLETANGSLDQAWSFAGLDVDFTGPAPFTQSISNDRLRLQSQVANGTAATFGTVTTESFTDVCVSAEASSSSDNFYGVGLRSNGAGDGYLFLINPHLGQAEIVEVGSSVFPDSAIEIATSSAFDSSSGSFFLVFEAVGTRLTGRVFDAPNGNLLATTTTTDASYSSGLSGVLASFNEDVPNFQGQDTDASWDNISSVVPAPTTGAVFLAGLVALGRRRCSCEQALGVR